MYYKRTDTFIKDLFVIEPTVYKDERGFFFESYNKREFEELGLTSHFIQDNHSKSSKGVIRGLHFQTPHSQGKLVRVIAGSVFDVAVDLRENSPTFAKYFALVLNSENKKQLYIPEGFAHAFLTLEDNTEFLYKTTDYYCPECSKGIIWNDPTINIDWPTANIQIILSEKDAKLPTLKEYLK